MKRFSRLIIVVTLLSVLAGLAARLLIPASYKATVQVLIDPRGLRIFSNDTGQIDANTAINFVESQMGVIKSERVLLRVLRGERSPATGGTDAASGETAETKALIKLQRAIKVERAERSFIVDVTAEADSPQRAADLANAVVKAYIAEDQIDRNASMTRVTTELTGRLQSLRQNLREAEDKVEAFRVKNGLVGVRDKLVIEQRLSETTTALTLAESREAKLRGKVNELASSKPQMSAIGELGTDPESRSLALLLNNQAAARSEAEQLSGALGEQHPALMNARNRLKEIDKSINTVLGGVRKAAQSQLEQTQAEVAYLSRKVSALSADLSKARQAEVGLRTLQADVEGNRKILESFETKARETSEFSQIDATSVRIVSPARAPTAQRGLKKLLLWGVFGGLVGAVLSIAAVVLLAIFQNGRSGGDTDGRTPAQDHRPNEQSPAAEPQEIRGHSESDRGAAIMALYKAILPSGLAGLRNRKKPISVLVSSGRPGRGKLEVAADLAWMAASHGRRALLVEADTASPALAAVIPSDAPVRLVKLAGILRPVYRVEAGSQTLSVAPILKNEQDICLRLALRGDPIDTSGVAEDFDFLVFDGPVIASRDQAGKLAGAADRIVLVAAADDPAEPSHAELVDWLGVPADKVLRTTVAAAGDVASDGAAKPMPRDRIVRAG
ncbi:MULTISPECIES: Wzz/FepE/Etk N-terminal domain-containing protein [Rhodopseudomonas]|uniref:Polysaccharide chain length determinant N-terminal domain-containing protein n=1 Tax=Rhodopseudomonas palustris TaxID=1076 RepID=A0A0D7F477_RHOPL|nr:MULTISPECIES: Wzz/FepE/Etk N-terminal domain-containing protein [Rhodopseudomonas]KIZ47615.1 hypothetical protein OO17_03385 [Rhodopseudomonas palustris]MDF3808878.1 hypothetical protein [Rhodopseudomonas sp. BAL398]WOK15839.1 hypothetical protein RBJ75_16865 [Rhodopseudomonas sp. BAL398]